MKTRKRILTEGQKMFFSVMAIFAVYAIIFILFEDYDRIFLRPFSEASDWHLLTFSLVVMVGLAALLHQYARRMDERISRTQAEKENRMRRELTQNIAHELKTPVTSILGYTETILDNPDIDAETQQKFILRTHHQARQLTAMLQDLSLLNRMDNAPHMLERQQLDVAEIVQEAIQDTAHAAEEKHVGVRNCLPSDISILANPQLIYSIFRNLLDNAINYAGAGATAELTAQRTSDAWNFCFSDNGQGVPAEHLPRIFERFYRLDKSRSRSLGGTGLGLSIVKNAVQMHGGIISASLNPEGGLAFHFTLKIK